MDFIICAGAQLHEIIVTFILGCAIVALVNVSIECVINYRNSVKEDEDDT